MPKPTLYSHSIRPEVAVPTPFDYIHADDPSAFVSVEYLGFLPREIPSQGTPNVYVYRASFTDSPDMEMYMGGTNLKDSSTYANEAAARVDVDRYTPRLGKLPLVYRRNIHHMIGYPGNGTDDASENLEAEDSGHFFMIFKDRATSRITQNRLEESFFHEASHASVQRHGSEDALTLDDFDWLASSQWAAAKAADDAFITDYAATADQEDFAESALFAYTLMKHPERLAPDIEAIIAQIPNRIAFFQDLVFPDHTIGCSRVPAENVKLPSDFTSSLVNNTSLQSHCRSIANLNVGAYYSSPSLVAGGVPDLYKFHCKVCGRTHKRSVSGGGPRPFWEVR